VPGRPWRLGPSRTRFVTSPRTGCASRPNGQLTAEVFHLFRSAASAWSIGSPREQRVHHKLDGRYSRTSPSTRPMIPYRMMWLPNNLRGSRGKLLKRACSRSAPDVRRRLCAAVKICLSLGKWPPALTPTPWACLRPTLRLPVTDCNAPGSVALTNAGKQAKYRERALENGTKTRGHFFLQATTKAQLLRLAHHRNCSVPAEGLSL
jgi:hypothetical protein